MNWRQSKPGYISKTIQHGPATITIHRPILTDSERTERKQKTVDTLSHGLRDYLKK